MLIRKYPASQFGKDLNVTRWPKMSDQ